MKSLYLLRHATPVDALPGQRDEDRRLDAVGFAEAAEAGRHIRTAPAASPPSVVLCSSAQRTLETLEALEPQLSADLAVSTEQTLYCASAEQILARIQEVPDREPGALVVGHNPGIAALAIHLTGAGDPRMSDRMSTRFPPGALAVLDVPIQAWSGLSPGSATLVDFWIPRLVDGSPNPDGPVPPDSG